MTPIAKVIKMHARDKFAWFYLPWIIMLSSFVINLIISYFVTEPIYTGGIGSIYVYMFVAGIIVTAQTFSFSLGFSVRRKDFFYGTISFSIVNAAINSFLLLIFAVIETHTSAWGSELYFFNISYLSDGSRLSVLWINFSIFMVMFLSGHLINCIYRRTGRSGMFIFFIIVSAIVTIGSYVCTYYNGWTAIMDWLDGQTALSLSLWVLPVSIVIAIISNGLLRRATV